MGEIGAERLKGRIAFYQEKFTHIRRELAKVIIGQEEVITHLIEALISNGHVLVEGVPGIAKTLTVRTLSKITGCKFGRIQFTPDLLPTDIIGITTYEEGKGFTTVKGPIFANFVLADEINRAPPKVQSALLEAMQESQVTIGKESFQLARPFFVMATQNPIENLGTYPLPEAQVDRFIFKLIMKYPRKDDEIKIMHNNTQLSDFDTFNLNPVFSAEEIMQAQDDVKQVYLDAKIEKYIVRIVDSTRNPKEYGLKYANYIEYGASPRATINIFIGSKARALVHGRTYVTPDDVKQVAPQVLRHRLILNFEGQAEGITIEQVIRSLLDTIPIIEKP